jgi:hypothetical protein
MLSRAASIIASSVIFVALMVGSVSAESGDPVCPRPGEVPATAADLEKMKAAGYPDEYRVVGRCWDPTSKYIGGDAAEAKKYLRSILCKGSSFGGAGPDGTVFGVDGKGGLDAKFAVCAAKFLKAMSSELQGQLPLYDGGTNSVCLREGYRTVAQQEKYAEEYRRGGGIACTRGASCEHPRGIAIDVNTTSESNYMKMWQLGPGYGVNFYLKSRDKVHFIPLQAGCSSGGVNPGASPTTPVPRDYYDYPQYAPQSAPRTTNPFANAFNPLQQSIGSGGTGTSYPTSQGGFNSGSYPTDTNSTPNVTTQTSMPTPTQTSTTIVDNPFAFPTSTNRTSSTTSAYETILSYTDTNSDTESTSYSTGTSSPVQLNFDLNDISTGNGSTTNIEKPVTIASTSVAINQVHIPNTFSNPQTQQNLNQSSSSRAQNETLIRTLLITLRDLLQAFLNALKAKATPGFYGPWQMPTQQFRA